MSVLTMPIPAVRPAGDVAERAREEMAGGRFEEARAELMAALDRDPSDWECRKVLAACLYECGDPLGAGEQWDRVSVDHPEDAEAADWVERLEPLVRAVAVVREKNPEHIQVSIGGGMTRVTLGGLVTSRSDGKNWKVHYARLTQAIERAAAHGAGQCIVDMTKVTFVSSYFQRLIAAWVRRIKPVGGRVVLAGTRAEIHGALLQAGVHRTVRFVESVTGARSCFMSERDR